MKTADLLRLFGNGGWQGRLKPEAAIQYRFVQYCRAASLEKRLDAVWFSVPNEFGGQKQRMFGGLLKALGKLNGVADMVFLWKDGAGCLEFKSGRNKQRPEQLLFEAWCINHGVHYHVVYGFQEAINALKNWNILKSS